MPKWREFTKEIEAYSNSMTKLSKKDIFEIYNRYKIYKIMDTDRANKILIKYGYKKLLKTTYY